VHDALVALGPIHVNARYDLTLEIRQRGRFNGLSRDRLTVELDDWGAPEVMVTHTLRFTLPDGALRIDGMKRLRLRSGAALGRWGSFDLRFDRPPQTRPGDLGGSACRAVGSQTSAGTLVGRLALTTPVATVRLRRIHAELAATAGTIRCPQPRTSPCPTVLPARGVRKVWASTTGHVAEHGVTVSHLVPYGGAEDDFFLVPLDGVFLNDAEPRARTAPALVRHSISVDLPPSAGAYAEDESRIDVRLDGIAPQLAGSLTFDAPTVVAPAQSCRFHRGTLSGDATATLDWGGTIPFVGATPLPATITSSVEADPARS
jgi:hypothetical protein